MKPGSDYGQFEDGGMTRFASGGAAGLVSELRPGEDELETKLNAIVAECISEGLSHFGGENVVESLLYILELDYSVDLRNIGDDLEALQKGLDKMFGSASYVVRGHICADLAKKLGLDPGGRTLEELVERARANLKAGQEF